MYVCVGGLAEEGFEKEQTEFLCSSTSDLQALRYYQTIFAKSSVHFIQTLREKVSAGLEPDEGMFTVVVNSYKRPRRMRKAVNHYR